MRTALTVLALLLVALPGCFGEPPARANDFVSSTKYKKLDVEIDYVEGFRPRDSAVNLLKQRMEERLSKPDGITFESRGFQSSDTEYSQADLLALERARRDKRPGGSTMTLYVLYLNGHHADDTDQSKILGVQFAPSAIAIFKRSIDGDKGLPVLSSLSAEEIERAVLVHEFGHAIGLVNHGLPMQRDHEDDQHPGHSSNRESVMYWAVETTFGLAGLTDSIPNQFDADDIADIRAAGGK